MYAHRYVASPKMARLSSKHLAVAVQAVGRTRWNGTIIPLKGKTDHSNVKQMHLDKAARLHILHTDKGNTSTTASNKNHAVRHNGRL